MARLAVIIPVHNRKEHTLACLRQLVGIDSAGCDVQIVIVDDGSTDGTRQAINEHFPDTVVLQGDGELWWTGAINRGVRFALDERYDYVLLLNDDLKLDPRFLSELWRVAETRPDALVSSIKLRETNNSNLEIISAGFMVEGRLHELVNTYAGQHVLERTFSSNLECDALTGASLLIPTGIFEQIGLLDARGYPHNWADLEFTRRAKLAGCSCVVAVASKIFTDANPRYHSSYLTNASRRAYIRNLFDDKKYNYGFKSIWRMSYLHKPFTVGTLIYVRRMLGQIRWTILKIVLTNNALKRYARERQLRRRERI
ncbi:MAG: glycosyltransferase family 2 protein [Gammaproteobacteria bacterium]|nr:glycosyltransferase family 2 protein [Gammaproteobacteria bacterium]